MNLHQTVEVCTRSLIDFGDGFCKNDDKFMMRERIILTGDSAGGFFTMTTWYRMKSYFKENGIKPALLSFIYPAFGYRFDSPRYFDSFTPLLCHHGQRPLNLAKIIMCSLKNSTDKDFQLS